MEIFTLLETLEDILERSKSIPLLGKSVVEKEELLEIIKEIRLKLPDELKQAKWVKEERQRIIADAQKEAEAIIRDAQTKVIGLIDDHEITRQALAQKEEIIQSADKVAKEISTGTREYADTLLERLEEILKETLNVIHSNRSELK